MYLYYYTIMHCCIVSKPWWPSFQIESPGRFSLVGFLRPVGSKRQADYLGQKS